MGEAGSGKSTCYQMLAKAVTSLFYGKDATGKDEELKPERSLEFQYSQKLQVWCPVHYQHV